MLNLNLRVSGVSICTMIYKKVVHFKFKFRGIFPNSRNICNVVNSNDLLQYSDKQMNKNSDSIFQNDKQMRKKKINIYCTGEHGAKKEPTLSPGCGHIQGESWNNILNQYFSSISEVRKS